MVRDHILITQKYEEILLLATQATKHNSRLEMNELVVCGDSGCCTCLPEQVDGRRPTEMREGHGIQRLVGGQTPFSRVVMEASCLLPSIACASSGGFLQSRSY